MNIFINSTITPPISQDLSRLGYAARPSFEQVHVMGKERFNTSGAWWVLVSERLCMHDPQAKITLRSDGGFLHTTAGEFDAMGNEKFVTLFGDVEVEIEGDQLAPLMLEFYVLTPEKTT